MSEQLNWENLRRNKCPKCGKAIMQGLYAEPSPSIKDRWLNHPCGFSIRESRYAEIVADRTSRIIDEENEKQKENRGSVGLEESR
jgi:hypothetical protein